MTKATHELKTELYKEMETLKRTQPEMKIDLKDPTAQLENSDTYRMHQGKYRTSRLDNKIEDPDKNKIYSTSFQYHCSNG